MNFVPYAIPFFVGALLLEMVYSHRRNQHRYRLNDTISSLAMGTLSRLRGVIQLGLGALLYGTFVSPLAVTELTPGPLLWIVTFVAYDICYYFSHRYGHEWRILWASHVAHHQSEEFNLSTALRQTSTGFLNSIFYVPLYLAGIPVEMIVTVGSLNLIYQFWVHTEHVRRLGIWDYIFVTPSNHRVHHAKNPCYLDRNYGGVFILWDRLFGTFADERADEPCVYGTTKPLASWNPFWANAHVFVDGVKDTFAAPRWRDKLLLWFKGPGWVPRGLQRAEHNWQAPKYNPSATTFDNAYAFAQFVIYVPITFVLLALVNDDTLPQGLVWAWIGVLAWGFYTQGLFLEGRRLAYGLEGIKLLALAGVTVAYMSVTPLWFVVVIGVYTLVCTAALAAGYVRGRRSEEAELPVVADHLSKI